jgi:two-component system chemotaxis response regulator CheY
MFSKSTRILVVDDMKTMRRIIKNTLTGLGMTEIMEAEDGSEAWDKIEGVLKEQNPFKLIISDWTMPKVTGLELLKKVRAHHIMGKVPFLLVTAEAEVEQVKEAIAAGVSGYITKPFPPTSLVEKLEAIATKYAMK